MLYSAVIQKSVRLSHADTVSIELHSAVFKLLQLTGNHRAHLFSRKVSSTVSKGVRLPSALNGNLEVEVNDFQSELHGVSVSAK